MRSHSLSSGGSLDACRVRAGRAGGSRALHAIPPHFYCGHHPPILHRTATSASAASRSSTDPAHADSGWHRRSASRTALRITVAACPLTIGSRRNTSNAARSLAAALRRAACPRAAAPPCPCLCKGETPMKTRTSTLTSTVPLPGYPRSPYHPT